MKLIFVDANGMSVDLPNVISMIDERMNFAQGGSRVKTTTRRRSRIRVLARQKMRSRFRLIRSPATGPLMTRISCSTQLLCRCRKSEFRSALLKKPWTSLFRK